MFGDSKRIQELEAENERLTQWVTQLRGFEAQELSNALAEARAQLETAQSQTTTAQQELGVVTSLADARAELAQIQGAVTAAHQELGVVTSLADARAELAQIQGAMTSVRADLATAQAQIVVTEELALLQEVGIYQYRHPLDDAVAYRSELKKTKDSIKALVQSGGAVHTATGWTVNGSTREGAKMTRDLSKLMLRAYNSEADNIVRTLRPYALNSATARLDKARETIAKLGAIVQLRITDEYHHQRVHELELAADYLVKVEEEKERLREERARQREDEKARREMETERLRLEKEQIHYQTVLARMRETNDALAIAEMESKLTDVESAIAGIEEREANIRAGYVYVISNFGSFGEQVVKIGLTRRLDPMERVRELGDASVPFNFDVHALVFSNDAVGLEGKLHDHFASQRVNLVNTRREFFYVSPVAVRDALQDFGGEVLLEFHEIPEASDWRMSSTNRQLVDVASRNAP